VSGFLDGRDDAVEIVGLADDLQIPSRLPALARTCAWLVDVMTNRTPSMIGSERKCSNNRRLASYGSATS
jgi:hypothetical protein